MRTQTNVKCMAVGINHLTSFPSIQMRTHNPEWNETFKWLVCKSTTLLTVTLWDKDTFTRYPYS